MSKRLTETAVEIILIQLMRLIRYVNERGVPEGESAELVLRTAGDNDMAELTVSRTNKDGSTCAVYGAAYPMTYTWVQDIYNEFEVWLQENRNYDPSTGLERKARTEYFSNDEVSEAVAYIHRSITADMLMPRFDIGYYSSPSIGNYVRVTFEAGYANSAYYDVERVLRNIPHREKLTNVSCNRQRAELSFTMSRATIK